MLSKFNSNRKIFFPIRWANSVTNWCLGLNSPSGTIRVKNTANPTDSGATIDVDVPTVASKIKEFLRDTFVSVNSFFDRLLRHIDGASIVHENGTLRVSEDWVKSISDSGDSSETSGTVTSVDGISPNGSGNVTLNAVTDTDIGVTVAAFNHTHDEYATKDGLSSATTLANEAKTAATAAKSTAETAKSTAETAKSTAETAKSTADTANSNATDAYDYAEEIDAELDNYAKLADLGNLYVTVGSASSSDAQTIYGAKTFNSDIHVGNGVYSSDFIKFNTTSSAGHGGYVAFHYNNNSSNTSTIQDNARGLCLTSTATVGDNTNRCVYTNIFAVTGDLCGTNQTGLSREFHICAGRNYQDGAHIVLGTKYNTTGRIGSFSICALNNNGSYYLNGAVADGTANTGLLSWGGARMTLGAVGSQTPSTDSTTVATQGWTTSKFSQTSHNHDSTYAQKSHTHGNIANDGKLNTSSNASVFLSTDSSGNICSSLSGQSSSKPDLNVSNVRTMLDAFETSSTSTITDDVKASHVTFGSTDASKLVATDTSGVITTIGSVLTSAPSSDKVLTCKSGGTALTWEDAAAGTPESPSSTVSSCPTCPGSTSTLLTAAVTPFDGTNGLVLRFCSRVYYDSASHALKGVYRDMTFDKSGRLYSVGKENVYTIETSTLVTWS